jgi:hypothetical protein
MTGALMRFRHLIVHVAMDAEAAQFRQVRLDHFAYQFIEGYVVPPAKPLPLCSGRQEACPFLSAENNLFEGLLSRSVVSDH